ncbi:MAG: citrate/2-methylcitrate synthase [Chromatiales bacterium]
MGALTTGGLEGVVAGRTSICTAEAAGDGLFYRGSDVGDLAAQASYEEVACLLLYGELPNAGHLSDFRMRLAGARELPPDLKWLLERLPAAAHPMDVLRTAVSAQGCLEPESTDVPALAERLLARLPAMLLYWYHFHTRGQRMDLGSPAADLAGHFLHLLYGHTAEEIYRRALEVSLILYAEHELNASTFAARVITSTRADFYSAIAGAIGALRGPLHGGANEAAMALIASFADADEAEQGILERLARKELIMGFGHRVYKCRDPRSPIIKQWARRLGEEARDTHLYAIAERIEAVMRREKRLFPNLDFYSALVYRACGIPASLFTPIFVIARSAGWAAHINEQRQDNRLIRPLAEYVGPAPRAYVPLAERS